MTIALPTPVNFKWILTRSTKWPDDTAFLILCRPEGPAFQAAHEQGLNDTFPTLMTSVVVMF